MRKDTVDWSDPDCIRKLQIRDRINRIRYCMKMSRQCGDNEFARDGWLTLAKEWQEDLKELKQPKRPPFRYPLLGELIK